MRPGRIGTPHLILASGFIIECCLVGVRVHGDLKQHIPVFFALFATAAVAYLVSALFSARAPLGPVIVCGVVFRATLLFVAPSLSDDAYRYVWDGRVQASGINPYGHAPASEALAVLREDAIYPRVNHPGVPTIYPPLSQVLFFLCYLLSPTVYAVKAALVLCDLVAAAFLLRLLRSRGSPPGHLLIYLWNPLLVFEVAGSGHVDALGVAFLAMALYYADIASFGRAGAALGLSALGKLYAVCLVPTFWPRVKGGTRLRVRGGWHLVLPVLAFIGVVALGFLPYAGAGTGLFAGLWTYAAQWEFNAPVFRLLRFALDDGRTARVILGLLFGCAAMCAPFWVADPIRSGYLLTGLFLWLTPTMHPWYVIWLLPFLVIYRSSAWLTFSCLAPLSYTVLIGFATEGIWEEKTWVMGVEYGGFVAVWAGVALVQRLRRGRIGGEMGDRRA